MNSECHTAHTNPVASLEIKQTLCFGKCSIGIKCAVINVLNMPDHQCAPLKATQNIIVTVAYSLTVPFSPSVYRWSSSPQPKPQHYTPLNSAHIKHPQVCSQTRTVRHFIPSPVRLSRLCSATMHHRARRPHFIIGIIGSF